MKVCTYIRLLLLLAFDEHFSLPLPVSFAFSTRLSDAYSHTYAQLLK